MISSVPRAAINSWLRSTLPVLLVLWSLSLLYRAHTAAACHVCSHLSKSGRGSTDVQPKLLSAFFSVPHFFHGQRGVLHYHYNTGVKERAKPQALQLIRDTYVLCKKLEQRNSNARHEYMNEQIFLKACFIEACLLKAQEGTIKQDATMLMTHIKNSYTCNHVIHTLSQTYRVGLPHKDKQSTCRILCNALTFHKLFGNWLEKIILCRCPNDLNEKHTHSNSMYNLISKDIKPREKKFQKRRYFRGKPRSRWARDEFVYGEDDRRRISPLLMRIFPYSNAVRLSTGCTGTLLTPIHVLTAAHCVHNGYDFRENLEMMRVEVPDLLGMRNFYIEKISVPSRWKHPRRETEHQEAWDYAVVTLSYGVHGRSQFFPLAVPTVDMLEHDLVFLGYMKQEDGQDHLWRSKCPGPSNKPLVDRSLIFTHCDSAGGNSGAAILAKDDRYQRQVIGVLSSTIHVRQKLPSHSATSRSPSDTSVYSKPQAWRLSFSVITALTAPKLWDICRELGEEGVAYGVCPKPQSIPVKSRHHVQKIPFFG